MIICYNMGNSQKIDNLKETIIWLDKNVFNQENKFIYEIYLPRFDKFNFICFTSVKDLITFITNKKNLNYFEFRLFYIIVSGRLAEEFYNEYVKITEKYNIIAATIVYCFNQKYHETKPYFKDRFLNSGGITFDFEDVANYILKDESGWENIKNNYKEYIPDKENFGDVFMYIDTSQEYELALPILIGKIINSSLIEKGEIQKFQNLLLSRYCNSYTIKALNLIKPSGNKNMDIPLHILTKFLLRFYTEEAIDNKNFYKDINRDLSNEKFDDYHPFIFLIYDLLNKGFIKSYKNQLCRAGKISKEQFNNWNENKKYEKNKKLFYFSKNFLSFSKSKNVAKGFLSPSQDQDNTVTILFILKECKNENFCVTNIDIESLSSYGNEKEVLILPLTCFEVVKIGDEEMYNNIKYRKIYLNYLDKYHEKILSKIEELREKPNSKEINEFFVNSINSKFGKNVQKCFDKNNKLSVNYCKIINASPDNSFFLSQIGTSFFLKINKNIGKSIGQTAAAHLDDELPNLIDDYNGSNSENKNKKIIEFFKQFNGEFKKLNVETLDNIDNSYSIGYCLGNFINNFSTFLKAPTSGKVLGLASLALGCGLPLIKLIPKIKNIIGVKILNSNIDVGMVFNGLNILWAVGIETFSIFKFHYDHKKKWNLTIKYSCKRLLKLGIAIGFSIIGNLACKAIAAGIVIFAGFALGPLSTIVIGLLGGAVFGMAGNYVGNYISDKVFGKDEFILTSKNLYYKYVPIKYRIKGNNPHLKWNKTYLCSNVKSYIIECIVNEVDTNMRVMNIPKDVFELQECLGYEIGQNSQNNGFNSDDSTDDDENIEFVGKPLFKGKKFVGDLMIPYRGISENVYKIDFVIYGIDKERISTKEWLDFRDKESKEKLIQIGFVLSVY